MVSRCLAGQVGEGGERGRRGRKGVGEVWRIGWLGQRPNFIETMHSYTLPMECLSGLHLSLLTLTAVCGRS